MKLRWAIAVFVVAVIAAGCGETGARTSRPDAVDEWQAPPGVNLDSKTLYRENRYLFDYDAGAPLDVEHVGTERTDHVTAYDLTYASSKGGRVPATLFVPEGGGPFGAILMMHGLPSNRGEMAEYAFAFAGMDAVVITIDAPFARPENDGREPLTYTKQDRDEQIQLIVDLRRAIDILVSRPEVDRDRMAYVGVSFGGAMGGLLAGVENRLQTYVLQVGDGGLVTHVTRTGNRGDYFYTGLTDSGREEWLEAMWPIEPIHFVGEAAPASLLFQNGTLDESVVPADAARYQEAGSEPKALHWYAAGHGISPAAGEDAVSWLQDHGALGRRQASVSARRIDPGVWIDRSLLVWVALTAGSLLYLVWALWRDRWPWGSKVVWVLAVLCYGPLGLLAYLLLFRGLTPGSGRKEGLPANLRALGSTVWSGVGNFVGVYVLALTRLYHPALVLLFPLATGFLAYLLSRLPKGQVDPWTTHTHPLLVQIVSTNMILVGAYAILPFALGLLQQWYPFGEPIRAVWLALVTGSVLAVLTGYPVHRWMVGREVVLWGPSTGGVATDPRRLPRFLAFGLIAASYVILIVVTQLASVLAG